MLKFFVNSNKKIVSRFANTPKMSVKKKLNIKFNFIIFYGKIANTNVGHFFEFNKSLLNKYEVLPRYWSSEGKAEVDFLIQHNTGIIPIEVKSAHSISGKRLHVFNEKFSPQLRIRYSFKNLKKDGNLLNIPVFLQIGLRN